MACFLRISGSARECEGCGAAIGPGLIGLTDEINGPPRLDPQCQECLFSLDRRLAAAWITSVSAMDAEAFDQLIRELLKLPQFEHLAGE